MPVYVVRGVAVAEVASWGRCERWEAAAEDGIDAAAGVARCVLACVDCA
jgi:hypothetical protein